MIKLIGRLPVVGPAIVRLYRTRISPFPGSGSYWERRYATGGTSGAGSYDEFARFKAEVLNRFVREQGIGTVIEYGCGDGNQLSLAEYPDYLGFDVSPAAVSRCAERFADDPTKAFRTMDGYAGETAELTLSLDVIYHLVEDEVYREYMERLFASSERFVVIYASNADDLDDPAPWVRHRRFSSWIEAERPDWTLLEHIPNRYGPQGEVDRGAVADFFIYVKT